MLGLGAIGQKLEKSEKKSLATRCLGLAELNSLSGRKRLKMPTLPELGF